MLNSIAKYYEIRCAVRFVALSDTHLYRPGIPDGDVLIHAGDICASGSIKEFKSEIAWLATRHNHEHIIYIPGNHDRCVESDLNECALICREYGIQMLVDTVLDVRGIKLFGCTHTPVFMNWAFMHTREQADRHWSFGASLYGDCDIWVTHGPPYGVFDSCPLPAGCKYLLDAVKSAKPTVHLFGHIHEGSGMRKRIDDTLFANIAVLDGHYCPAAPPFVFDLTKNADS